MIRDGGAEYLLFFPQLSEGARVVGYGTPPIRELLDFSDERALHRMTARHLDLSWSHAVVFVHQLQRLATDERHHHGLRVMELVAQGAGALPLEP